MNDSHGDGRPKGRNVITGQARGVRFDEARTNVYMAYRASQCGPDSPIDTREHVAFPDTGLDSQADGANVSGKVLRWINNTVAQASGFGITRNLMNRDAALIQSWLPGARWRLSASRSCFTARRSQRRNLSLLTAMIRPVSTNCS